jgi:hypothetical protein
VVEVAEDMMMAKTKSPTACTWGTDRMQGRQSDGSRFTQHIVRHMSQVRATRGMHLLRVSVILTANPPPVSLQWITLLRCKV